MSFKVIGTMPHQHPAETTQFERVLKILGSTWNYYSSWAIAVIDIPFAHEKGNRIDGDYNWNGQIDILLLMENKIVTYELKGFTAKLLHGTTDDRDWEIETVKNGRKIVSSFFQQASRGRAFLLQDHILKFMETKEHYKDCHWVVDARVVMKPNSDFSGFFYRIPRTIKIEELEKMIETLSPENKGILKNYYSGIEYGTGKARSIKVSPSEYRHIYQICFENNILQRTMKWFSLIREDEIAPDLGNCGSSRFHLLEKDAVDLAMSLKERA